ncbi:MAG: hydrogenase 4 subunit F [Alistipes sp.]|nr:hydrogenase 4 subunit F [Alistipes senegalensis]MCM1249930.1 hydrogenase 4 subunit F [Alistipes sp.]
MMIAIYFLLSAAVASSAFAARSRRMIHLSGSLYYLLQSLFAAWLLFGGGYGRSAGSIFEFDAAATLFYALLIVVSFWVFHHSETYLAECDLGQTRTYFALLMLLTTAIAGAYFASNMAVTWIFLEATTLCSAGIIYHRRTAQTLEAAWKYVFVSSTGIAMAYLGILLLTATTRCESLSYEAAAAAAAQGNPLYLKISFLLILCGYSCKMELFPLYTVGVDANFAAPAPAAALISTGLVNAGFLAILRLYRVMSATEVFGWAKSVLLLTGVLSLLIGALFLRRTNNYKRFLSYSTVENMGIAAIGLGIGGAGVWAAVFHVVCHTFVKSSLFLQMGVVRQVYNGYRINRLGDYIRINRVGAVGLLAGMVVAMAFPPSPLFISELMILRETIAAGKWWLVAAMLLLLCIVIYSFCLRMIRLCYQPNQDELHPSKADRALSRSALLLLLFAVVLGLWQPEALRGLIDQIAAL